MKTKISLIGMPSAGKSTVGAELAKKLNCRFLDLDHMVEVKENESLISILEKKGGKFFLDIEYKFLLEIEDNESVVISTAGSIIYHQEAIEWLKIYTTVVFLDTPLTTIESRLSQKPKAVVGLKEKGLERLWNERIPIYNKYADITITTVGKTTEEIVNEIISCQ